MNFYDDIGQYGDSVALLTEDSGEYTYSELLQNADSLKANLQDKGLVFNLCSNCIESVVGYMGFLRARNAQLLLSNNMHHELIENLLLKYKPKYLWLPKFQIEKFQGVTSLFSFGNYELVKTSFEIDYEIHEDLALLLTTSGSTGSPKLVRQSFKNITANAVSISEYLEISASDRPITTLPMNYTFGLSIINSHLLKGSSIILTSSTLFEKTFWELLKKNKATTFSGVPYTYEILKKLGFSRMKLDSVKKLTQAGGKLNQNLSAEFAMECKKKGMEFIVMYGQTEATARMAYLPSKYAISKAGSIGLAIPGGEFFLKDETGNYISEPDKVGELIYKGDNVTMGYAHSYEDLQKGDENNGILETGDMAERDKDGFYYIVGRKKRFLKIFGNRVNLDEVEQLLLGKGYSCVCAGTDNNLKVYITEEEKQSEVKTLVAEYTGFHPSGFNVIYIEKIPRNEYGRVTYSVLN